MGRPKSRAFSREAFRLVRACWSLEGCTGLSENGLRGRSIPESALVRDLSGERGWSGEGGTFWTTIHGRQVPPPPRRKDASPSLGPLGFNAPNIAQRHALHVERTAEKAFMLSDLRLGTAASYFGEASHRVPRERELSIDNLLVRVHRCFWCTGLAPWEFESPFPGSLISTFLGTGCPPHTV